MTMIPNFRDIDRAEPFSGEIALARPVRAAALPKPMLATRGEIDFTAITLDGLCGWMRAQKAMGLIDAGEAIALVNLSLLIQRQRRGLGQRHDPLDCLAIARQALTQAITANDAKGAETLQRAFDVLLTYQRVAAAYRRAA